MRHYLHNYLFMGSAKAHPLHFTSNVASNGIWINYVTLKGGGGISQCDDVYIKHTSVWDIV